MPHLDPDEWWNQRVAPRMQGDEMPAVETPDRPESRTDVLEKLQDMSLIDAFNCQRCRKGFTFTKLPCPECGSFDMASTLIGREVFMAMLDRLTE